MNLNTSLSICQLNWGKSAYHKTGWLAITFSYSKTKRDLTSAKNPVSRPGHTALPGKRNN